MRGKSLSVKCGEFAAGQKWVRLEYLGAANIALYRPCLPYPLNARMTYVPLQHLFPRAHAQLSQKVHLFEVKSLDLSRTHR